MAPHPFSRGQVLIVAVLLIFGPLLHTVRGLADSLSQCMFASLPAAMLRCRGCSPRQRSYGQPCGTLCSLSGGRHWSRRLPQRGHTSSCVSMSPRCVQIWSIWIPRVLAYLSPSHLQDDAGHVVRIPSETGHFGWYRLSDNSWLTSEFLGRHTPSSAVTTARRCERLHLGRSPCF